MDGSPLGVSLGSEGGSEIDTSNGRSYDNTGGKPEGYLLRELLCADGGSEIGLYNGMSYGNIYGKLEGSSMGE